MEDFMKPAILVIDMQKQFFKINEETSRSLSDATEYINEAIRVFREKRFPVISIQHMNPQDGLMPGKEGFDLPEDLAIDPGDLHIQKIYGNSFVKTPLLDAIKPLGVDTAILCGFCAEFCVLSTYHGAKDVDLFPIMLRGGLASVTPKNIAFVEEICELISLGALAKFLE